MPDERLNAQKDLTKLHIPRVPDVVGSKVFVKVEEEGIREATE